MRRTIGTNFVLFLPLPFVPAGRGGRTAAFVETGAAIFVVFFLVVFCKFLTPRAIVAPASAIPIGETAEAARPSALESSLARAAVRVRLLSHHADA
jgi:hypothetical protein